MQNIGFNSGCFSDVGYLHTVQELNLDEGCRHIGIIMHEIMHGENYCLRFPDYFRY